MQANNNGLFEFHRKIDDRLADVDSRNDDARSALALEMAMLTVRHEEFQQAATKLVGSVIAPRVESLAERFDNAAVRRVEGHHQVRCEFRHNTRFPATVELVLGVTHDDQVEQLNLYYDVSILPVFMKFTKHDQATWSLNDFSEPPCATWVEARLVDFLDTYLRIEEVDQYHQETLCTDPVCGMRIRKSAAAARAEHRGATFFFCVEACRDAFVEQPSRYVVK